MQVKVKGWAKFQHFKDRKPPWIKLYRDLLDDREWHKLDGESAKILVMLWLIASENSGNLPDIEDLAFRFRLTEEHIKLCISRLSHWLDLGDINLISDQYQDETVADIEVPLRDRDRDREETEEIPSTKVASSAASLPNCPHLILIELFGKHLPTLPQPKPELWEGAKADAMRARWRWVLTAKKKNGDRYAESESEAIDWFDRFFAYVAESDFLTGRSGKWTSCDLGWLVKADNFSKVVQGNYENKE